MVITMSENLLFFGVGWGNSYVCGSSTFCIMDDEIYLIQEDGEIDWENSCEYLTVYKEIWEIPILIREAHSSQKDYEQSYRWVENNKEMIMDLVKGNGADAYPMDFGRYCLKFFSPRRLNLKGDH